LQKRKGKKREKNGPNNTEVRPHTQKGVGKGSLATKEKRGRGQNSAKVYFPARGREGGEKSAAEGKKRKNLFNQARYHPKSEKQQKKLACLANPSEKGERGVIMFPASLRQRGEFPLRFTTLGGGGDGEYSH